MRRDVAAVHWGMSRHLATLTLHESLESLKPFYASVVVYNLAMGCTKYSLLLQYLRIFPHKAFRRAVFVMLGVNTVYVLWTTGSAVFACWPVSYFWTQVKEPEGGRCLDRFAVWYDFPFAFHHSSLMMRGKSTLADMERHAGSPTQA